MVPFVVVPPAVPASASNFISMMIDMLAKHFDRCQYVSMAPTQIPLESPAIVCCTPLLGAPLDEHESEELADVLKALADPVRLRLVSIIGSAETGEICACDLPGLVARSQPTVSHHLSLLVKAGIVDREQRGKWAWFRLREEQLAAVAAVLTDRTR